MKFSEYLNEKYIKAPSGVLEIDPEYAMKQFFEGKASLSDLKETIKEWDKKHNTKTVLARKSEVEKMMKNSFMMKVNAHGYGTTPDELKKRLKEFITIL